MLTLEKPCLTVCMKYLPNQWKLTGLICVKPYFLRENSTTGIYPFSTGELLTCMVKPLCTPIIKVLCWRIRIPSSWIMISLIFLVGQRPPKKASQICCHHLSAACWNQWKLIVDSPCFIHFHKHHQHSSTNEVVERSSHQARCNWNACYRSVPSEKCHRRSESWYTRGEEAKRQGTTVEDGFRINE